MTYTARQLHRLKFRLWYLSRVYPTLGEPLRWMARQATSGFTQAYKQRLDRMGTALFPPERYERPATVACQFITLTDDATSDELRGLALLLNHFRIPYHRCQMRELSQLFQAAPRTTTVVITVRGLAPEIRHILDAAGPGRVTIIAFASNDSASMPGVTGLASSPAELLPHRSGLRSSLTRAFVRGLLHCDFPVVSGFLPPQVGLRVDDVAGATCHQYVPEMNSRGWTPNLGIFLQDFGSHAAESGGFLSALDRVGRVECSPHAQTADDFLFYNYKDGEPFSDEQFAVMWQDVLNRFDAWGLSVCPVLNAHFHAFSPGTYPLLSHAGVKYIFSELAPDGIGVEPGPQYLPSGDPLCTTGQAGNDGMYQIHSGDPTVCCNLPDSTYDFLMHNHDTDVVVRAGRKIAERLALSLETGFAAFATTHEYLLDALTRDQVGAVLDEADRRIADTPCRPTKVPLSEIGRACENHTNVMVQSVQGTESGWTAAVTGRCEGDTTLCIFGRGEAALHSVPAFRDVCLVESQQWG